MNPLTMKSGMAMAAALSMVAAFAGTNAVTPAVDDLSRAIRNFQDLDSWHAATLMNVDGKKAEIAAQWDGVQMIMNVTTIQGKHYTSKFSKAKSYLSGDGGKTWEADADKTAEQQLKIVMAAVNWDGKGKMPGRYQWAGTEMVDADKTLKITGAGENGRPATYWIYDHPKYGKMLRKSQVEFTVGKTVFQVTCAFSDVLNKGPQGTR